MFFRCVNEVGVCSLLPVLLGIIHIGQVFEALNVFVRLLLVHLALIIVVNASSHGQCLIVRS